jgi:hypothetical protein
MEFEQRLRSLERANSRMRAVTIAAVGLICVVFTSGTAALVSPPVDLIRAKVIEIVDSNGVTKIRLAITNGQPQIELRSGDGTKKNTVLSQSALSFFDESEQASAHTQFSLRTLTMADPQGNNRVSLTVPPATTDYSEFSLNGTRGHITATSNEHGAYVFCVGTATAQTTVGVYDSVAEINVSDPGVGTNRSGRK